eukprot:12561-Heterococcus_DN1.PRE.2
MPSCAAVLYVPAASPLGQAVSLHTHTVQAHHQTYKIYTGIQLSFIAVAIVLVLLRAMLSRYNYERHWLLQSIDQLLHIFTGNTRSQSVIAGQNYIKLTL